MSMCEGNIYCEIYRNKKYCEDYGAKMDGGAE